MKYRHPIEPKKESTSSEETSPKTEDPTPDSYDGYLNMEIGMPRGEDGAVEHAIVKRRAVDYLGQPV
jgi:hypothetical protein